MVQEHEILEMLNARQEQGMGALFGRFYRPLVVFADSYLHDMQESEDVVQEQMVKLWTKRSFEHIAAEALSTFLFTVVRNACINRTEKKKVPLRTLELPHFRIAEEEAKQLDESVMGMITEALGKLPDRTRQVVEYVMLQDKMYKEAAAELGVSVNTVKTLLRQGIRELREELKGKEAVFYFLLIGRKMNINR